MQVAEAMLGKSFDKKVLQLNMGEGKSKVILPLLCAAAADGKELLRVIVLHPLLQAIAPTHPFC